MWYQFMMMYSSLNQHQKNKRRNNYEKQSVEKRPEEEITTASRKNTGDGTGFGINVIA